MKFPHELTDTPRGEYLPRVSAEKSVWVQTCQNGRDLRGRFSRIKPENPPTWGGLIVTRPTHRATGAARAKRIQDNAASAADRSIARSELAKAQHASVEASKEARFQSIPTVVWVRVGPSQAAKLIHWVDTGEKRSRASQIIRRHTREE